MYEIKFPIALHKPTNKLINISEATNGKACQCDCFQCGKPFIAVNNPTNKVSPHFKHDKGQNCTATFESYIHWLTKKVFQSLSCFNIPAITSKHLSEYQDDNYLKQVIALYNNKNVPEPFRRDYKINIIIQEEQQVEIKKCETETSFATALGPIRADIVVTSSNNNKLLIEPYLTHPIDNIKKEKITELNESVLAINLYKFVSVYNYLFTIEEFSDYIAHQCGGKYWVYFKKDKVLDLQKKFFLKLEALIDKSLSFLDEFRKIEKLQKLDDQGINELEKKIDVLVQNRRKLDEERIVHLQRIEAKEKTKKEIEDSYYNTIKTSEARQEYNTSSDFFLD